MRGARAIARWAAFVAVALALCPAPAPAFQKAIWGQVYRHGVNQFPLYRKLGVGIFEIAINWADTAPTRPRVAADPADPAYHWPREVTEAVRQAARFHMRVLIQLIFTPAWANGGRAQNYPPKHRADFATFAAAAARRYPGVHLWMIWGEPTRAANFAITPTVPPGRKLTPAQQTAPHTYARLLDGAYGALKAVSRRNLVIGGSTYSTGDIRTPTWIANLRLPNGRPPRMDLYGDNPFSVTPPSFSGPPSPNALVQFKDLPRLAGWIDRYLGKGIPIFISEYTIPTGPDEEFDFYVDQDVAADWTRGALREARRWHRIYALGWIHVYDDPPVSSGGLLTVHGTRKPDYYAFMHG
jgi:hypothetical protein